MTFCDITDPSFCVVVTIFNFKNDHVQGTLEITLIQLKVVIVSSHLKLIFFQITYILCNITCYNVDMLINKALSLCTCPVSSGIHSAYIMCQINLISVI